MFSIIGIRLYSILNNKEYYSEKLKEKTNIYVYGSSAPRGRILDTNGKVLVDNKGIKTIYYNKIKNISINEEIKIAEKLANIVKVKEGNIRDLKKYYLITHNNGKELITENEYKLLEERKISSDEINDLKWQRITDDFINYSDYEKNVAYIYSLMNDGFTYQKKKILSNVNDLEYAKVIESNIPGITGEISWERVYLYGDTLKNVFGTIGNIPKEKKEYYINLGYELTDLVGLSYLEYEYEDYLKGKKAKYLVNNDNTLTIVEEQENGNDLVLSIDIDMQLEIENILKKRIEEAKKNINTEFYRDSYAIVSNPLDGQIIALGGIRLNNDNTWSNISLNTINKSYTMGSAVKGATIGIGYKYDLITMGKYITDSCVKLYLVPQKCSHARLGRINDLDALAYSSNYYQYLIAIGLTGNKYKPNMKLNATKEHFDKYRNLLASFGLGAITGIDLPGETQGIKGSIVSDDLLLNLAIGQYDTYTPIEMVQYINSVASGKRIKLSLMKEIKKEDSIIYENKINVLNNVDLDSKYLDRIRDGMEQVLLRGTGKFHVVQGLNFVGKTGTSESFLDSNNDGIVDVATITSTFLGYYPKENPKFSLVVITPNVSHKNGKKEGIYPVASKITKEITTFLSENY